MPDEATHRRILVADDEPDIVALVSRRLTKSGFTVITAVNGAEALLEARAQKPDLALLDVMMPKLTGIEVSRLLRSAPETHPMPVILMSAAIFDKRTTSDVCDAFLAKPFAALGLCALVLEVLARTPRGTLTHEPA